MKRRPLRLLLRAERRVVASQRGAAGHRSCARVRQRTTEQRLEAKLLLRLRGWSQKRGGGWSIRPRVWPLLRHGLPEALAPRPPRQYAPLQVVMFGLPYTAPAIWAVARDLWLTLRAWPGRQLKAIETVARAARRRLQPQFARIVTFQLYGRSRPAATPQADRTQEEQRPKEWLATWSVAGLAALVVMTVLPHSALLWFPGLLGLIQGVQAIGTGTFDNDPAADRLRPGGTKINQNLIFTAVFAGILNVGMFAYDWTSGLANNYTAAQMINAAWTYAGGNNPDSRVYDGIYIPKKAAGVTLLPFNITQVTAATTYPGVHPIREGGILSLDRWDPCAYGAAADGTTDDWAAWEAIFTAYQAAGQSGTIDVPPARDANGAGSRVSKPLWVRTSGTQFGGLAQGRNSSIRPCRINPSFKYGYSIVCQDLTSGNPNYTTALVGSGNALLFDLNHKDNYFGLRDAATLDLNGSSALTVECFVKIISTTGSGLMAMITSGGRWLRSDTFGQAFQLCVEAGGRLQGSIKTTTQTYTILDSVTLSTATVWHAALQWDGSNLRLFKTAPGSTMAQVASTATTGTLVQSSAEDVTLGAVLAITPDSFTFNNFALTDAVMDSPRISKVSRGYTTGSGTAPNGKFSKDSNTAFLANFATADQYGPMTRADTYNGDFWCLYRQADPNPVGIKGVGFKGISVYGGGNTGASGIMMGHSCDSWHMYEVEMNAVRHGLFIEPGAYFFEVISFRLDHNGQPGGYGILGSTIAGASAKLSKLDITGGITLVHLQAGGVGIDNAYLQSEPNDTVFPLVLDTNGGSGQTFYDVRNLVVNTETGNGSVFRAACALAGHNGSAVGDGSVFTACAFETQNNCPHLITDTIDTATFNSCTFQKPGTSVGYVHTAQGSFPPIRPLLFTNCTQSGGWVPWSNNHGDAMVGLLGKSRAITFGSSPTFDCSKADSFELTTTLTGNLTGLSFTNYTPGQRVRVKFIQDGTGSRTINVPANMHGDFTVDPGANKYTILEIEPGLTPAFPTQPDLWVVGKAVGT